MYSQSMFDQIRDYLKELPNKKHHVEFLTAVLSVPVLLTVILLNINNLNKNKEEKKEPTPRQVVVTIPVPSDQDEKEENVTPTKSQCQPGIGPIEITSPKEGETISDDPVNISIQYKKGDYCAVVWSYRINLGKWSEYDDKSIALYNLPLGAIKFELRVKSIVSGEEKNLERNFINKSLASPTLSPTQTPTPTLGSSN